MKLIKKLGQNFLNNQEILAREAAAAGIRGKVVLEIGPGDGRLTKELLKQEPKKIYAVEKDARFAQILRNEFNEEKKVVIIEGDFLKTKMPEDVEVVVGNIPYYLSSKIIFRLKDENIEKAVLMVQKEFAEKMIAKPKEENYGRLSVTSQIFFDIKINFKVPAHYFVPRPKVDSALITLIPKGMRLSESEEEIIRRLFQQKNKKIRNILKSDFTAAVSIESVLAEWQQKRPRELSPNEVLQLIREIKAHSGISSENSSAS